MRHKKILEKLFAGDNKTNRLTISISALGLLFFLLVAFTFSFQTKLFNTLFPKPFSQAAGLNLSPTINSIGIEVPNNTATSATLKFKKSADTAWRNGLDLWQTGGSLYGSALLLEPGTAYDIEVTPALGSPISGKVSTRADTNSASLLDTNNKSTLTPTHCVDGTIVNDTNNNGAAVNGSCSGAAAWKTLNKAVQVANAATTDMVIQVAPGYYQAPISSINPPAGKKVTFVAEFPAVDNSGNPINAGKKTVIEPRAVAAANPSCSATTNPPCIWQKVSLQGPGNTYNYPGDTVPSPVPSYDVWKWTGTPATSLQLGFASTRDGLPLRVAHWANKGTGLATPQGWAEMVWTNHTYRFGFYTSGSDIYLRLPVNQSDIDPNTKQPTTELNPNNYWVFTGGNNAFTVDGSDVRVSGFEIKEFNYGITFNATAKNGVVDHNYIIGSLYNIRLMGNKNVTPNVYGTDHTVEYNRIEDTGLWETSTSKPQPIPWAFIKYEPKTGNGGKYSSNRIGEYSETRALQGNGFAQRLVVRNNIITGTFDGLATYNASFDRYASSDIDIYNNKFSKIADDAFEPENQAINWRVWNNTISDTAVMLSTGPVVYGPIYLFKNQAHRISAAGVGKDRTFDNIANNELVEVATSFFKYSGNSTPPSNARIYVYNNTFWTDYIGPSGTQINSGVDGGALNAGGTILAESFYLRNNIMRASRYAFSAPRGAQWNEDYNHFATSNPARGFEYGGTVYTNDISGYRTASGLGQNSNKNLSTGGDYTFIDTTSIDNNLNGAPAGDLTLKTAGSIYTDAGTPVPNITDLAGFNFQGSKPDIGACEGNDCSAKIGGAASGSSPSSSPSSSPPPTLVSDAQLSLKKNASTSATLKVSDTLKVDVSAKTGISANLINAKIQFNPSILEVDTVIPFENDLSSAGSIIDSWADKSFDNTLGEVSLVGGIPNPGFSSTSERLVVTINFKIKATASNLQIVSFDKVASELYANADNCTLLHTDPSASSGQASPPVGVVCPIAPTTPFVDLAAITIQAVGGVIPSPSPTPSPTPTTPTSSPSPTPTSTPIVSVSPTPSPSPIANPCVITSVVWNSGGSSVNSGVSEAITVTATGDCSSQTLTFEAREDDGVLGSQAVKNNPSSATFASTLGSNINQLTTSWVTEYLQDGFFGINDPPEYFIIARLNPTAQAQQNGTQAQSITSATANEIKVNRIVGGLIQQSRKKGDDNNDGIVDQKDYSLFSKLFTHWAKQRASDPVFPEDLDTDDNGVINSLDFSESIRVFICENVIKGQPKINCPSPTP